MTGNHKQPLLFFSLAPPVWNTNRAGDFLFLSLSCTVIILLKGLVHWKLKIIPWFTHPQAIQGVYD